MSFLIALEVEDKAESGRELFKPSERTLSMSEELATAS
jgi:hypothetical protein